MPSKSAKQHRFMEAVAHGMKPKKGKGPSVKVAKEFVRADDTGKQLDDQPVVMGKKPLGQAQKHSKRGK